MKSSIFWDITLKVNRRFGGTYRLHLQGWIIRARYQRESRWKAGFHDIISQKKVRFVTTGVRTSNPTQTYNSASSSWSLQMIVIYVYMKVHSIRELNYMFWSLNGYHHVTGTVNDNNFVNVFSKLDPSCRYLIYYQWQNRSYIISVHQTITLKYNLIKHIVSVVVKRRVKLDQVTTVSNVKACVFVSACIWVFCCGNAL
jgi:hypothetical protein